MLSAESGSISLIPLMFSNLKIVQKELHLPPQSRSAARVCPSYVAIPTFLTPGQRGSWEDSRGARQIAAKSLRRGIETEG